MWINWFGAFENTTCTHKENAFGVTTPSDAVLVSFPQGPDVGGDTAIGRAKTGTGPRAIKVEKTGRIDAKTGRRNEAYRRATVSDDTQTSGRPAEVR